MTIAGLGGCNDSCAIEDVLAHDIDNATPMDCGPVNTTKDALRAGHDCAVAANAAQQPFELRWETDGIDSGTDYAYLGLGRPDDWSVRLYISGQEGGTGSVPLFTSAQTCGSLGDLGEQCGEYTDMCLACVSPTPSAQQCP
jgi:hypothetical protein